MLKSTETHIIDTDADSFCPEGWKVLKHRGHGKFVWDFEKISLFCIAMQNVMPVVAVEVENVVADKSVMNANVLDYLLEHSELIPEAVKEMLDEECASIVFWGTTYLDENGKQCVRCLSREDGDYCWSYVTDIESTGLMSCNPAAMFGDGE